MSVCPSLVHAGISPETFIYSDDIIGCKISKFPAVVTFESVELLLHSVPQNVLSLFPLCLRGSESLRMALLCSVIFP